MQRSGTPSGFSEEGLGQGGVGDETVDEAALDCGFDGEGADAWLSHRVADEGAAGKVCIVFD